MYKDKNFQKRTGMMKILFEAQIPHGIIVEVTRLSPSIVIADRKRVEKEFSIQLPKQKTKEELYPQMVKILVKGKWRTSSIMWEVAETIVGMEVVLLATKNMGLLWEKLKFPQKENGFNKNFLPYFNILQQIFRENELGYQENFSTSHFKSNIYDAIRTGKLDISLLKNDVDFIALIASYFASRDRKEITSLPLDEKTIIEDVNKRLEILSERDKIVVQKFFGLGYEKKSFKELGEEFSLTSGGVRRIKETSLRRMKDNSLLRNIKSEVKISFSEKEISQITKDQKLGKPISILTEKVVDHPISVRTLNCLKAWDIEYFYQVCENWKYIERLRLRNLGKKGRDEIKIFFKKNDIKPEEVTIETIKFCEEYLNQ